MTTYLWVHIMLVMVILMTGNKHLLLLSSLIHGRLLIKVVLVKLMMLRLKGMPVDVGRTYPTGDGYFTRHG